MPLANSGSDNRFAGRGTTIAECPPLKGFERRLTTYPISPLLDTRIPRRRWGIALLLGVGILVNYIDRVNLSVALPAKG